MTTETMPWKKVQMQTTIAIISTAVSILALVFARQSSVSANRSSKAAEVALREASVLRLFQCFEQANQATLENPDLLYDVHGLDRSYSKDEARRIAYLSFLLDGFQHHYGQLYSGDFNKMADEMMKTSTYLNLILAVPENFERWNAAKSIYYGDFDKDFVAAIERLLQHERHTQ